MTLSSFLRISPRFAPVTRQSRRAASTATNAPKSLDSILIANRGEIALYAEP